MVVVVAVVGVFVVFVRVALVSVIVRACSGVCGWLVLVC